MRKIAHLALLFLAGCTTLSQMNRNMENTNVLLSENSEIMTESKAAIEKNTSEIHKSTRMMQLSPIVGVIFLLIVFIPIAILFKLYRKLEKRLK